jgi:hypothetical protein
LWPTRDEARRIAAHFVGLKEISFRENEPREAQKIHLAKRTRRRNIALARRGAISRRSGGEETMARLGGFLLGASILVAIGWVWSGRPIGAVSAQAGIMVLIGIALYALTGVPPA